MCSYRILILAAAAPLHVCPECHQFRVVQTGSVHSYLFVGLGGGDFNRNTNGVAAHACFHTIPEPSVVSQTRNIFMLHVVNQDFKKLTC